MQSDKCIAAATPLDRSWSCGPLWQRVLGLLGFLLLQTPWYIVRWLCSLVQLPALLGEGHVPNDEDVVALMEASVLCMMLTVQPGSSSTSHPDNSSGRCWEQDTLCKFEFRHCQLVSAGRRLHSMSLVYRKQQAGDGQSGGTSEILCCMRNGEVLTSREQMYATLVQYLAHAVHPKIHVAGTTLISRLAGTASSCAVAAHDASILSACSYNTVPLHIFLMHTPWSPIANSLLSCGLGYDTSINKDSVVEEAINMADMVDHKDKFELVLSLGNRYTNFLVHSRAALLKVMLDHHVDAKLFEQLWLQCVVHALDHVTLADLIIRSKVLFDAANIWQDSSTLSRVRGCMFVRMFIKELGPLPWTSNKLKDLAAGHSWVVRLTPQAVAFWRDLHHSLGAIDPTLADQITASIMY